MSRQDPANRAKIWHEPLFDNMELLRASYTTHAFSLHFHEGFAVGVIEQGMQKARIGTVPEGVSQHLGDFVAVAQAGPDCIPAVAEDGRA